MARRSVLCGFNKNDDGSSITDLIKLILVQTKLFGIYWPPIGDNDAYMMTMMMMASPIIHLYKHLLYDDVWWQ